MRLKAYISFYERTSMIPYLVANSKGNIGPYDGPPYDTERKLSHSPCFIGEMLPFFGQTNRIEVYEDNSCLPRERRDHAQSTSRVSWNGRHKPPNSFGGLRTGISVWRFASPIVSSLSIQSHRQGRADAPLARSWDRRMHLQFAALPFRVNSPAGVGAVL